MKKIAYLIAGAFMFTAPAFAADLAKEQADVKASEKAIIKDDAAIAKQQGNIEVNRAEKADAKNDLAAQAGNSVEIGANKTAIQAKKLERKVDEKILESDKKDVEKASGNHKY